MSFYDKIRKLYEKIQIDPFHSSHAITLYWHYSIPNNHYKVDSYRSVGRCSAIVTSRIREGQNNPVIFP